MFVVALAQKDLCQFLQFDYGDGIGSSMEGFLVDSRDERGCQGSGVNGEDIAWFEIETIVDDGMRPTLNVDIHWRLLFSCVICIYFRLTQFFFMRNSFWIPLAFRQGRKERARSAAVPFRFDSKENGVRVCTHVWCSSPRFKRLVGPAAPSLPLRTFNH